MSKKRKSGRGRSATKANIRRGVATGGTVTLAALGLTNCQKGGVVDPLPPPPIVCDDANNGQILDAVGSVEDTMLTVLLFSAARFDADTVYVSEVTGATLDSLDMLGAATTELAFTLDADTTFQVTFTVSGAFVLEGGLCDFTRSFTVTIDNGQVDVAESRIELPLKGGRDIRIEVVERDGLRVRLRAAGGLESEVAWSVTGGGFEPGEGAEMVWTLPAQPGFYQVELVVDRGDSDFGFDALSFQVT